MGHPGPERTPKAPMDVSPEAGMVFKRDVDFILTPQTIL